MKILKLNDISPLADVYFRSYDYSEHVKNPDAVIVRSASMADFKDTENLIAVARAGAGTNNIPSDEYAKRGIVVFNTPGANANAVKELTICELLLSCRDFMSGFEFVNSLKDAGVDVQKTIEGGKSKFGGREIHKKTLGVIGLGAIGLAVAKAAVALGMNVLGYDVYMPDVLPDGVEGVERRELVERSDFITLHIPLCKETRGTFDEKLISLMKDGAVLINNSRGEICDSAAVKRALESGKLARYISDFPCEELIGVKNALLFPHLGASTAEAEDNCAVMAAEQLKAYIEDGNIKNSVNYPAVFMERNGSTRVCVLYDATKGLTAHFTELLKEHSIGLKSAARGAYAYLVCDMTELPPAAVREEIKNTEGVYRIRVI